MKRFLLGVTILGAAAVLGGCPIYPSQSSGYSYGSGGSSSGTGEYQVCTGSTCYSCPSPNYSSACVTWPCQNDSDCGSGYTCVYAYAQGGGTCAPSGSGGSSGSSSGSGTACNTPTDCPSGSTCGQDSRCHSGDCGQAGVGCVSGYICRLAGGKAQCVDASGDDGGSTTDDGPAEGGGDATTGDDASPGDDGSSGGEASTEAGVPEAAPPPPCNADSDCAVAGSKCINGSCTARVNLCSDTTQCSVHGSACVDGVCEERCNAASPCPTGYSCDLTRGVCNINPTPCTSSSTCQGGTICVEQHCVPPCAVGDAGVACPSGQLCVNGGCIPDQSAKFACLNDGQTGEVANRCVSGICVHHDCYTACNGSDGGACSDPSAPVCKMVTIETGTYAVCGTATTLGSDCDPAQGKYPSGCAVCIDGYCRYVGGLRPARPPRGRLVLVAGSLGGERRRRGRDAGHGLGALSVLR